MVRRIARLATANAPSPALAGPGPAPDPTALPHGKTTPYSMRLRYILTRVSVALQKGNSAHIRCFRAQCVARPVRAPPPPTGAQAGQHAAGPAAGGAGV